jgi:hypothetical protein
VQDAVNRLVGVMTTSQHVYEVRQRKDHRGVDLISDALPFGRLWYEDASAAVDYAKHSSRSHDAVIRVYDDVSNVIETHEHTASSEGGERGWLECWVSEKIRQSGTRY